MKAHISDNKQMADTYWQLRAAKIKVFANDDLPHFKLNFLMLIQICFRLNKLKHQ